jgi:phosphatidylserine decarboxylase
MDDQRKKHKSSAIARSMERDWSYFANFTTGTFISEGAFKRVFKVFNKHLGFHEALSVM